MATRRERVILDLEDHLSPGMLGAAASTGVLKRELNSLSNDSVRTRRSVSDIDRPVQDLGRSSNSTSREVDKLSGRLRIFADLAAILGPTLAPIAGVAVPAVTGLAAQFGFAAGAAGVAVLAFQGVGDALKALNDYRLAPTDAHLQSLREKMSALGPAGRDFVRELQELRPALQQLQNVAQAGLFPGLVEGLQSMETALPKVEAVVAAISSEMGHIADETGASLASDRWTPFLDFIAREAPSALGDMAKAAGNTAHAVAELFMATDPLNDDFSQWLVQATADLDRWASGLAKTQGFQDFVDYIETNGPQVAETFGAIANAVIQIVQAAAPLGGPVLAGVEALANVVAALADSDIGTPLFTAVAALALFNRSIAIAGTLQGKTFGGPAIAQMRGYGASLRGLSADWTAYTAVQNSAAGRARATATQIDASAAAGGRLKSNLIGLGKGAAIMGGLAVASTGAADKIGLTNTLSLGLAGTFAGPVGTAIGTAVGATIDLAHANDGLQDAITRVNAAARSGDLSQMSAGVTDLTQRIDDLNHTSSISDFFGDLKSKAGSALNEGGLSGWLKLQTGMFAFGKTADQSKAKDALTDLEAAMNHARDAASDSTKVTDVYGRVLKGVGDTSQDTAAQIHGMVEAMQAQRQEALSAFSAETRYRQALKDAQEQAKKSNAGIKGSSDEALKNRQVIDELASAWNNQSDAVKNNQARFKAAKSAFIETATAMGVPEEAARRLARRLLEIPEKKVIGVQFDAVNALNEIARVKREMAGIKDKSVRLNYYVNQVNAFNKGHVGSIGGITPADGATVPGQRHPYGDKVLAMLAPGEEVVSNRHGQADRWRPFLKAINDNRLANGGTVQRIPAYADGGRVAFAAQASAAGPAIDYARLASAITGNQLLAQRVGRDMLEAAFTSALQKTPVVRTPRDPSLLYGTS